MPVTPVEELTGFPECLDGRVKTLHPRVHAGILADRRLASHRDQLAELGIEAFDLVVSNLYPFTETVLSGAPPDECVEQIDIGGPAMVRAAAKNHPSVAVVVSPARYADVLAAVRRGRLHARRSGSGWPPRRSCTRPTYDVHVASWMGSVLTDTSDGTACRRGSGRPGSEPTVLRYGENPHQRGRAVHVRVRPRPGLAPGRAAARQGRCRTTTTSTPTRPAGPRTTSTRPAVAIIKHANPCGIAVGADVAEAHRKAHACDPVSAFGGVIAVNRPVSAADGRAGGRGVHRGGGGAGLRARRARRC